MRNIYLQVLTPGLLALLAATTSFAQTPITLTQNTYPAAPGTVLRTQDANVPNTLPAPTLGANQTWDYRALTPDGAPYSLTYQPVPTPALIGGAQWTRNSTTYLGNFAYNYTAYDALGSTGTLLLGRTVARQAQSLATTTGNPNDSLVINRQTILYNGTAGVVNQPLPFTVGGYANRAFRYGTSGLLTIQALGLIRTPLRIVQRFQYVDSVGGWGTVRVPVAGQAGGSAALRTLLVRSRVIEQDSFFLNGSPAPAALLVAFGVAQGQRQATYYDDFLRTGSVQPVLELFYTSRQYSSITYANYSAEGTLLATRELTAASAGFGVWPNPTRPGQLVQLELPAAPAGQPLPLTVRDALGRPVATGTGAPGQPTALLNNLPPGVYLLEAQTPAGPAVRRVTIE